ncbi:hypothetical protein HK104_000169 [Borealophlyctis nickersoniae]|nr:hypothetical protein HK104_000169 [Borealophlyctis nickersoniae]
MAVTTRKAMPRPRTILTHVVAKLITLSAALSTADEVVGVGEGDSVVVVAVVEVEEDVGVMDDVVVVVAFAEPAQTGGMAARQLFDSQSLAWIHREPGLSLGRQAWEASSQ